MFLCPCALGLPPGLCGPGGQGGPCSFGAGSPAPTPADQVLGERREAPPTSSPGADARRPAACIDPVLLTRPSVRQQRSRVSSTPGLPLTGLQPTGAGGGADISSKSRVRFFGTNTPKGDYQVMPQFRSAFREPPPFHLRGGGTIEHSRQRGARLPGSPRPGQDLWGPCSFRD